MRFILLTCLTGLLVAAGCKKDPPIDPKKPAQLSLSIIHEVDGEPLAFDSLKYYNAAGERFSVVNLKYYISNLRFFNHNSLVYTTDTVWYIDAALPPSALVLENMPGTAFDSVDCFIGVEPSRNIHDKLAPTLENKAMEWPDGMGGGYHFLKLEGHWVSGSSTPGFAVHIGTDPYLITAGLKTAGSWPGNGSKPLQLSFNVAEWFRTPHTYSLAADGVYTMGNAALMQKIKENGRDVFTVKP